MNTVAHAEPALVVDLEAHGLAALVRPRLDLSERADAARAAAAVDRADHVLGLRRCARRVRRLERDDVGRVRVAVLRGHGDHDRCE